MVKLYIVDVVKNRFLKRQRITYIKANRQTGRQTDKRRQRTPKTITQYRKYTEWADTAKQPGKRRKD